MTVNLIGLVDERVTWPKLWDWVVRAIHHGLLTLFSPVVSVLMLNGPIATIVNSDGRRIGTVVIERCRIDDWRKMAQWTERHAFVCCRLGVVDGEKKTTVSSGKVSEGF